MDASVRFALDTGGIAMIPDALRELIRPLSSSEKTAVVKAWIEPYTATTPMAEYSTHRPPLRLPKALWDIVGWIHVDISNPIMELWASTHQQNCETCGWHTSGSGCNEPEFLRTRYVTCGQHEQWKPKTTDVAELSRPAEHIEIHLEVPDAFVDNRSLVEVLREST